MLGLKLMSLVKTNRNGKNGTIKKETLRALIEAIKNEKFTSIDMKIRKIAVGCDRLEKGEEIFSYFIEISAKNIKENIALFSIEYKDIHELSGDIFDIKNYIHKLETALLLIQKIRQEAPTIEIKIIAEKKYFYPKDWEEINKRLNMFPSTQEGIFIGF